MYGYIYKTTDLKNGKIYIGQKKSNKFLGINYIGSGLIIKEILENLLNEGINVEERFSVELLEQCNSKEELDEREIYWIDALNSRDRDIGYNLRKGGECGPGGAMFKGHRHSEETKKKMSKDRRGENNANFGNKWRRTPGMKYADIRGERNPMYGKKHSVESIEKNRKSNTGKVMYSSIELDKVVRINKDEIELYESLGYIRGNIHNKKRKKN